MTDDEIEQRAQELGYRLEHANGIWRWTTLNGTAPWYPLNRAHWRRQDALETFANWAKASFPKREPR